MNITATSKLKNYNTQKTRLSIVLLTVVLIVSLLIVGVIIMTNSNDPDPYGIVHVKNEKELVKAINKAKNPTTIQLDNDITLTKPLVISNNKEISLTSNTTIHGFFKLLGATDQTTITIDNGGVLHLDGIIVTHKVSSIYGNYIEHENGLGVNVTEGGKLFMVDGEISGNNGDEDRLSYGGGVAVYADGFFEMSGGLITSNRGSRFGGGVWVGGFFIMSGNAVIANNYNWTACTGCGVYNEGYFEMSGNSVIANNTAEFGGGVYNEGYFVMMGNSMITNNNASWGDVSEEDIAKGYISKGGGVHNWGSFEMTDNAVISGNVADQIGRASCRERVSVRV
jgi:hypothetical protein